MSTLKCISKFNYEALAQVCDDIIRSNRDLEAIIAQDCIHISRYSPTMQERYAFLNYGKLQTHISDWRLILKSIMVLVRESFLSLASKTLKQTSYRKIDFLIVSHYNGKFYESITDDPYFGEIAIKLVHSGKTVILLYLNHTDQDIDLDGVRNNLDAYLVTKTVNFKLLMRIYHDSLISFIKFKGLSGSALKSKISRRLRLGVFDYATIKNRIYGENIRRYVDHLKPAHLLTTYEGHAWERLAYAKAKLSKPSIKCIAYQHAPIFLYQNSLRRGIGENYDPDFICASGLNSEKELLTSARLGNSKIILLGSGRKINVSPKIQKSEPTEHVCLVAPEGSIRECEILFRFALQCAGELRSMAFIWRFPHQITINTLRKNVEGFDNLESNIAISKLSLEDDIRSARYILYRGSSVAVLACQAGLIPVYFLQKGELTMDPLYGFKDEGRIVSTTKEFSERVSSKVVGTSQELMKYCSDLYSTLDTSCLVRLQPGGT